MTDSACAKKSAANPWQSHHQGPSADFTKVWTGLDQKRTDQWLEFW
ncbi:hypothetical protein CCC_00830 [Paramagnetospirillum magnetotacticum MS-1]|uniref:Uncharacterized protein n=1 Tax=Paramagnetospirillum magnetotacticum MS-1 TaxID=272627 RepID=A0A0C2YDH9_PARME|nr:hypothetical protein [Paramagnetospirillum magnetotacticum]KIL97769.1 hypothetical protein CCC_00830 [Paramagnetospirillum magnetotacticum MS-1]